MKLPNDDLYGERVAEVLRDLYEIDPGLKTREDEMKKAIRELLDSKPEAQLDPRFKAELRERLLKTFSEKEVERGRLKKRGIPIKGPWVRTALGLATAAALIVGITLAGVAPFSVDGAAREGLRVEAPKVPGVEGAGTPLALAPSAPSATGSRQDSAATPPPRLKSAPKISSSSGAAMRGAVPSLLPSTQPLDLDSGRAIAMVETPALEEAYAKEAYTDEALSAPHGSSETETQLRDILTEDNSALFAATPPPNQTDRRALLGPASSPLGGVNAGSAEALLRAHTDSLLEVEAAKPDLPSISTKLGQSNRGTPNGFNTEGYDRLVENQFLDPRHEPLSTLSIDVDTASYSNIRRFLNAGSLPPADAVRIEELVNYFPYSYKEPTGEEPFAYATELAPCPWNREHYLLRVGLQAPTVAEAELPPSNLVFLIDVSGSMEEANKLPLVKESLKLLVAKMRKQDRISLVVYAGNAGQVLAPTSGDKKGLIGRAIDELEAGGSTAGGEGISLAYEAARSAFIKGGNNRVILATDGDFNVGPSSDGELVRIIEEERKSGVYLTILGFGMGNYQDAKMQKLADSGNGNYAYVDSLREAEKVLGRQMAGTLYTIAKDVKIQIEFNPATVASYRLLGYEKRLLAAQDFANDAKDAGELGAGHRVTVFYEITPASGMATGRSDLKYQSTSPSPAQASGDLMTIKLRYKKPGADGSPGQASRLLETAIPFKPVSGTPSEDFRFAAAVAEWGLLLRDSEYRGSASYAQVEDLAAGALARSRDPEGYRTEFLELVRMTMRLVQN